jgi:hypothetical protein
MQERSRPTVITPCSSALRNRRNRDSPNRSSATSEAQWQSRQADSRVPGLSSRRQARRGRGRECLRPRRFRGCHRHHQGARLRGCCQTIHFRGGDITHGAKGWHRRTGAIGSACFPAPSCAAPKCPGTWARSGARYRTLRVIQVREADHLLLIKGRFPVPAATMLSSARPRNVRNPGDAKS